MEPRTECLALIRLIERQVLLKVEQAHAVLDRGANEEDLQVLYPYGRDAWNSKAAWLEAHAPAYLSSNAFIIGRKDFPDTLDAHAQAFFDRLFGPSMPDRRGRDIVADVANHDAARVFPHVQADLDRLRTNCRAVFEKEPGGVNFRVMRMPETWEAFLALRAEPFL